MSKTSKADEALLLRFNITQTIQIQLTRLNVYAYSNKAIKSVKCHFCKYSSKVKARLRDHLRTHTGEKPFPCTLCKFKSSHRSALNTHIMTHTGEKPWDCTFCKTSFRQSANKIRHEKTCKLNPKQMSDPSWVQMQKTFKCQVCPYSASEKSDLKQHTMTHTGEKPFPCTLCNLKFSYRGDLRRHIFTHTREKPHACQFCNSGFVQATNQKVHEKICKLNPKQGDAKWVEEQKKFKCHFCIYRTTRKGHLEEHLRSHTGEKPFSCPFCFYKCRNHSALHCHLRRKHVKENGYKCPNCAFTTLLTSKLLSHVKQIHVKL